MHYTLIFSELSVLVGLTKLLKMASFPVVMVEQNWEHRFPTQTTLREKRMLTNKVMVSPAIITPLTSGIKTQQNVYKNTTTSAELSTKLKVQNCTENSKKKVPTIKSFATKTKAKENTNSVLLPRKTRSGRTVTPKLFAIEAGSKTNDEELERDSAQDETNKPKLKQISESRTSRDTIPKGNIDEDTPKSLQVSLLQTKQKSNINDDDLKKFREPLLRKIGFDGNKKGRPKKDVYIMKNTTTTTNVQKARSNMEEEIKRAKTVEVCCNQNEEIPIESEQKVKTGTEEVIVEITDINIAEGSENLLSVSEAFEKSQRPDFNDVLNPILNGTDTEKVLVRSCVICSKQLLGRNAYGRHMKNVHPKVFGPYKCPAVECAKPFESGYLLMQHMYVHLGPRGRAAGRILLFKMRKIFKFTL